MLDARRGVGLEQLVRRESDREVDPERLVGACADPCEVGGELFGRARVQRRHAPENPGLGTGDGHLLFRDEEHRCCNEGVPETVASRKRGFELHAPKGTRSLISTRHGLHRARAAASRDSRAARRQGGLGLPVRGGPRPGRRLAPAHAARATPRAGSSLVYSSFVYPSFVYPSFVYPSTSRKGVASSTPGPRTCPAPHPAASIATAWRDSARAEVRPGAAVPAEGRRACRPSQTRGRGAGAALLAAQWTCRPSRSSHRCARP